MTMTKHRTEIIILEIQITYLKKNSGLNSSLLLIY